MTAEPARPVRILVVDDHPIVRLGIRQMIAAEPDLTICGEAGGSSPPRTATRRGGRSCRRRVNCCARSPISRSWTCRSRMEAAWN